MNREARASASSLVRAIAANPRDIANYLALADFYRADGDQGKAAMTLRRVLEIDPLRAGAWRDLGEVASRLELWQEAAEACERAAALAPEDPGALFRYGSASLAARDPGAAAAARDRLLERFPGRWEGQLLAGHLHKIHGAAAPAAEAYRRALAAEPRQTDALFNLVDVETPLPSDGLVRQLESLRAESSLSCRDAANVLFALARIRDRAGQTQQAMALWHEANATAARALEAAGIVYDPARMEAETARVTALFDRATLASPLPPPGIDMRMIFVTGMPRSGTTLVERILGSHPAVVSGGEMPFMQACLAALLDSRVAAAARGALDAGAETTRGLFFELREQYLDRLFERGLEGEFVIDKLPANFAAIGLIRVLFPDALILHCARDPMATCWSLYTAHFGLHLPYNTNLRHLAHYCSRVHAASMRYWRSLENSAIIDADYDRLVADPDAEIRALVRRCGLAWDERCLAFHENEAPVFTANMLAVRQPISAAPAGRWRRYEQHLGKLKEELRAGGMQP